MVICNEYNIVHDIPHIREKFTLIFNSFDMVSKAQQDR